MAMDSNVQIFYHIVSLTSELATIFWIYAIYFKTTKDMKLYKSAMLQLAISDLLMSIFLFMMVLPDFLFPLPGAVVIGPAKYIGREFSIVMFLIGGSAGGSMVVAVFKCSFLRYCSFYDKSSISNYLYSNSGVVVYSILSLVALVVLLFLWTFGLPDQPVPTVYAIRHNLTHKFAGHDFETIYIWYDLDTWQAVPCGVLTAISIAVLQGLSLNFSRLVWLKIFSSKETLSPRTYLMQRNFTILLVSQCGAESIGYRLVRGWFISPIPIDSQLVAMRAITMQTAYKFLYQTTFRRLSTIRDVKELKHSIQEQLRLSSLVPFNENDVKEKVLAARSIADSHAEFCIPLSTDGDKRAEYLSGARTVRLGKLLEDLDMLAVFVSQAHNRESTDPNSEIVGSLPRTIVTGTVHRIDMHRSSLHPSRDIIIDGRVTWTGRSSMETSLRVFQRDEHDNLQQMMRAHFIMVSRHPTLGGAVRVHPLKAISVDDAAIISAGQEAALDRKRMKETSLLLTHPSLDEFRHLHENFLANVRSNDSIYNIRLQENQMWIHDSRSEVKLVCFPEHQNIYGKIFGGFLMRRALELACLNAQIFCKGGVQFISVDDITFARSVEISDILHLTCILTYSQGKYVQARVVAEVVDAKTFSRQTSNVFHFTMQSADGHTLRELVPKHYEHGTMWLNGKRHLDRALTRLSIY